MKLDEEVKVLENLKSGHSCQKYGFLPIVDIRNVFEKLPDIENSLKVETRMTSTFIAGYICCKNERIDHEKYTSFLITIARVGLKALGDMVRSGHFIVILFLIK